MYLYRTEHLQIQCKPFSIQIQCYIVRIHSTQRAKLNCYLVCMVCIVISTDSFNGTIKRSSFIVQNSKRNHIVLAQSILSQVYLKYVWLASGYSAAFQPNLDVLSIVQTDTKCCNNFEIFVITFEINYPGSGDHFCGKGTISFTVVLCCIVLF